MTPKPTTLNQIISDTLCRFTRRTRAHRKILFYIVAANEWLRFEHHLGESLKASKSFSSGTVSDYPGLAETLEHASKAGEAANSIIKNRSASNEEEMQTMFCIMAAHVKALHDVAKLNWLEVLDDLFRLPEISEEQENAELLPEIIHVLQLEGQPLQRDELENRATQYLTEIESATYD